MERPLAAILAADVVGNSRVRGMSPEPAFLRCGAKQVGGLMERDKPGRASQRGVSP